MHICMFDIAILFPSILNGMTTGAVYALIALGLTLIYGVLHIINFAHGAALMVALYAVYLLRKHFGIDPYLALPWWCPACSCSATPCSASSSTGPATARTRTSCWSRWACRS